MAKLTAGEWKDKQNYHPDNDYVPYITVTEHGVHLFHACIRGVPLGEKFTSYVDAVAYSRAIDKEDKKR